MGENEACGKGAEDYEDEIEAEEAGVDRGLSWFFHRTKSSALYLGRMSSATLLYSCPRSPRRRILKGDLDDSERLDWLSV